MRLRKGIDYSKANWGDRKSDDKNYPIVTDIYSRTVQLPHYVLLADREKLDYIVNVIKNLK